LATDYGTLRKVSGGATFDAACRAYIEANPSDVRNVRWYGGRLPDFLERTEPWAKQPWLAEIARFEWTLTLAFDAADAAALRFADLAGVPPEAWPTLAFSLHPSVHLVRLRCNAAALRTAVDEERPLPPVQTQDHPVDWVVWRRDDGVVHFRSLQPEEGAALRAVRDGATFVELCSLLAASVTGEAAAAGLAAGFLRTWVDDRLVSGLSGASQVTRRAVRATVAARLIYRRARCPLPRRWAA
jgi:hypothetical protein